MSKRRIEDLIADEYPISVIARRAGVTRQDVYCFLAPTKYRYRLTEEKLRRIAMFEGRSVVAVRNDYQQRAA